MPFPKESLEDVVLYPCNISGENQMPAVLLNLTLKNYSKLQNNKIYYKCIDGPKSNLTMMIVISRKTLFVFFSTTTCFSKVCFRIQGKKPDNKIQPPVIQVIERYLFVSEFRNKVILNLKNEYLDDDVLIIQCICNTKEPEPEGLYTVYCQKPDEEDVNEISNCLMRLYNEGLYSDFIIKVKNTLSGKLEKFHVHRAVLAARSQFFGDLFTADNKRRSIILKGSPAGMREVILYMYSGKLNVTDAEEVREVSDIADMLQMDVLKKRFLPFDKTLGGNNTDNITIEKPRLEAIENYCTKKRNEKIE